MTTIGLVLVILFFAPNNGYGQTQWPQAHGSWRLPPCALWDRQASDAIVRYVQREENHNLDLRQLGDAIARMRSARRNCELGWVQSACQGYHIIIDNFSAMSADWPYSNSICPQVTPDRSTASNSP